MTQPGRVLSFAFCTVAFWMAPGEAAAQLVYVTGTHTQNVAVVDVSANKVVAMISTVPYTPGRIAITPDARWAYVANVCSTTDPGSVSVLDLVKNSVAEVIIVGSCPSDVAIRPDGAEVYVSNRVDDSLSIIQTGISPPSVSSTIPNVLPTPYGPDALAVSSDGTSLYVSTFGVTYAYDTTNHNLVGTSPVGGNLIAVRPGGGEFWATGGAFVNTSSGDMVNLGWCTAGQVVFTPDAARAFVADSECGGIYDMNARTLTLNQIVSPAGDCSPPDIAISSDGGMVYSVFVTCPASAGTVKVAALSTATDVLGASVAMTGFEPAGRFGGIAVSPANTAATSTVVVASVNPSVFGQQVSFTATVWGSNVNIPTGSVTFYDGGMNLGSGTSVGNGVWIFGTSAALSVGAHSITASYSGDGNFAASTSAALTQIVNQAASTTALTASPNPAIFGQPVTLTATVSAVAPGAGTPSAAVNFFDGGVALGPGTLNSGQAMLTIPAPAVGPHSFSAVYAGDTDFLGSSSTPVSDVVSKATPSIVWAAPAAIVFGAPLSSAQLNATSGIAGSFAYTPPAGTVLGAGTQTLLVTFTPADAVDYTTATATVSLTVGKATPTISWTAPAAILAGAPLTGVQLNATATVPGTFAYSPAAGALLPAGIQTLSTTFTPNDAADYTTASASVLLVVDQAPTVLSPSTATFTEVTAGSFTFQTSGFPLPALAETGNLPAGLLFTNNGNGTATLSGSPAAGTAGNYPITITAANGVGANTTQSFTLTVEPALPIYSGNGTTFTADIQGFFLVGSAGTPVPAFTETGKLPAGVTFVDNRNGTATLSGTPAPGTAAIFPIIIQASNSIGATATQNFTLTVNAGGPAILTGNVTAFAVGSPGTFTVESAGFPIAALLVTGSLPAGVTFVDNGDGTGTLSGTPDLSAAGTYSLTISADNGTGSTASQSFTLFVNPSLGITSTNTASFVGQAAGSFTITASGKLTPALTETGSLPNGVTFTDNGNGSATLSGTPAAGSSGLYGFTVRASNGVPQDAIQTFLLSVEGITAVAVSSPTSTALAGQLVSLTATVSVISTGIGVPAPSGTITFFDNGANLGTAVVGGAGTAIFTTSTLAPGTHSINVQYSGDFNYSGSTSPAAGFALTIIKSGTSISIAAPPTPSTAFAGQPVTLVANLTVFASGPGVPPPSGTVTFLDGTVPLGTAPLVSSTGTGTLAASATFVISTLAVGTHTINVQYSGDPNYFGSGIGGFFPIAIIKSGTTVAVAAPPTPSTAFAGQQVTLTANLSVGPTGPGVPLPGGTITFLDGTVTLGTAPLVSSIGTGTLAASATFMISTLAPGTHTINVQYSGDPNYFGSGIGGFFPIAIIKSGTTVAVAAPPTPGTALAGQQVTLTANLSVGPTGPGVPLPGGTITFLDGTVTLGTAPLVSSTGTGTLTATATFMISTLAAGTHTINVQYSGDPNYFGSSGVAFPITIQNTPTGTGVSVRPVDANTGTSPVTLTFAGGVTQAGVTSLTISTTGPATPSGFAAGTPATYFNLSTTALFTPPITVCINYTGMSFPSNTPALFHYENSMWVNVTTSVDTINMIVCGSVTSLSPFAIFAPPPVLTIAANSATRRYGQANPTFGVSYNGFVNGDGPSSLSGTLLCSSPATPASPVGTYPIACSGLTSSKYTIMYAPGVLTTTPAPLTVTAANQQRVYGATNPALTGTIAGIQNGDNITATYTTTATPASAVGVYAIVPVLADPGAKLGNYGVTLINGALTVIPASTTTGLSVVPNPSTFGQSVTLTATVTPVAPGAGTPTGTVTFRDGSVTLATRALGSADTATFTTASLADRK